MGDPRHPDRRRQRPSHAPGSPINRLLQKGARAAALCRSPSSWATRGARTTSPNARPTTRPARVAPANQNPDNPQKPVGAASP